MIFSHDKKTIESSDVEGVNSLTSDEEFVHLAKVHGFAKLRDRHQKPGCAGQDPRMIGQFRVIDEEGDEIRSDDEFRRAMARRVRSPNPLHPLSGQAGKYASQNDAPIRVTASRTDWEQANVDVICPDCAALSTARLIEMAQGPEAAEEFMQSVMGRTRSGTGYSSSSIVSYDDTVLGSASSYRTVSPGKGAGYGFFARC